MPMLTLTQSVCTCMLHNYANSRTIKTHEKRTHKGLLAVHMSFAHTKHSLANIVFHAILNFIVMISFPAHVQYDFSHMLTLKLRLLPLRQQPDIS